jgi:signal transduction histidine kinase
VVLQTKEINKVYCLYISDTGCGIPEEKLTKVFEPFVQVNSHDVGTGLGLTLVKAYCDAMAIAIEVESKLGNGTTFTLKMQKRL